MSGSLVCRLGLRCRRVVDVVVRFGSRVFATSALRVRGHDPESRLVRRTALLSSKQQRESARIVGDWLPKPIQLALDEPSAAIDRALSRHPNLARCMVPVALAIVYDEPREAWWAVEVSTRQPSDLAVDAERVTSVLAAARFKGGVSEDPLQALV